MTRLSLRRNPLGLLFSSSPWAAAWYLFGYLIAGTLLFAVVVCATVISVALGFTVAGLFLLAASASVIRGCAAVERARLRTVYAEPVRSRYRDATGPTWLARLRTRWTDPALWRDLGYLVLLFGPLFALDSAVLCIWLTLLAGITSPAWYGIVQNTCVGYCTGSSAHGILLGDFPHGPHGAGASGFYIDSLPSAVILAAVCLAAFVLFSYVMIATARLHAAIARSLLRPPEDPLKQAREVLRRPGPLRPSGHEQLN